MTTLTHRSCTTHTSRSLSIVQVLTRAYGVWTTRRALSRLDATQLNDVGVTAAEADREARRAIWDVPANWRD